MVLILTDAFDAHADIVINELEVQEISYFRLNLDAESLKNSYVTFKGDVWSISACGKKVSSDAFSCVWCRRPFVELSLQERRQTGIDFQIWKNEWNKTLLGLYNSIKGIPWLNPLRKAYKGENKYYQMEVAKRVGFKMPEMVISNSKLDLLEFASIHERIVFKLMSQEIYDLGNDEFKGLYTNVIGIKDLESFEEYAENPIVLQEYIEKKYEVRYTVVSHEHLVCRIDSQLSEKAKEDWRRYDIANTPHFRIEPPDEIQKKVSQLLCVLGLEYGALDFIVTPSDEWVFLEINCLGQWLWIEQLTGMQISKAIVDWIQKNINYGRKKK